LDGWCSSIQGWNASPWIVESFSISAIGDFDALFVGCGVERAISTFRPVLVVVAAISFDYGQAIGSGGRARQFLRDVAEHGDVSILFHFDVPGG